MKNKLQKPTSDIAMLKHWHNMAETIHSDATEQKDEMISFLAAMLSAQIYERLGEQEASALLSASG
ncbi:MULTISPECIES: hypothetical protein [unclassified Lentilitoribacter]|jgi:hypothetical protein|uniref:hypothetical protein n=1 Tax=unclassified Lentilitoribacter TaxID=2647570 RepID=UPI0013A6F3DC|nr:hypothetical protein [Lentilitoribacter sp. Alg239-R112]